MGVSSFCMPPIIPEANKCDNRLSTRPQAHSGSEPQLLAPTIHSPHQVLDSSGAAQRVRLMPTRRDLLQLTFTAAELTLDALYAAHQSQRCMLTKIRTTHVPHVLPGSGGPPARGLATASVLHLAVRAGLGGICFACIRRSV